MSIPHPLRNAAEWGRVLIGGSEPPGILESVGLPPRVWEFAVQQGYDRTKVTIYRTTGLLEKIELVYFLRLKMDERDDFDILTNDYLPTLIPGWPNRIIGRPKAFPFIHPAAQMLALKRSHLTEFHTLFAQNNEKVPQWCKYVFQEDMPQKIIPVGPPEPAKINGPPAPTTAIEAGLLNLFNTFKAP